MSSTARETFAARFGEDQAAAVETAAIGHFDEDVAISDTHANDNRGSDWFHYWFLLAIGRECVTRFREHHGITADVDAMKDWARTEGALSEHDGDLPDYIAALAGAYDGWLHDVSSDEMRWAPEAEVSES